MSVLAMSAIKADIGGYVGHSEIHPDLIVEASRRMGTAIEQGLLIDGAVNSCGDDINLVMTHRHGADAEPVHHFAHYTTMPQVAEGIHERWEAIDEAATVAAQR